jgi:hypothetical protein
MSLHIALCDDRHLRFSVSGNFDCDVSREILKGVKAHWRARVAPVHADLSGVTEFSQCAVSLLILLVEMLNGDFHLDRCSAALEAAYVDALMKEGPSLRNFEKGCNCLPAETGNGNNVDH